MPRYDTDNFDVDVLERSREKPVLVDFWAAWCGPCRVIGPVLERLADDNGDDWELRKLDTEKHPAVARRFRITSIPAVKLFVDGEVKDEFVGALPEQVIVQWLKKALPSKFREHLKRAEALLAERNLGEAHYLLSEVLENDPDDEQGIVLMAKVETVLRPGNGCGDCRPHPARIGAVRDRRGDQGPLAPLSIRGVTGCPRRRAGQVTIISKPSTCSGRARTRLLLRGLIDVIRRNRYYDDDGARKAVIAVFKLLGEDHETTRAYRNPFANALYYTNSG